MTYYYYRFEAFKTSPLQSGGSAGELQLMMKPTKIDVAIILLMIKPVATTIILYYNLL
jgi:hypothetical protein